MNRFIQDLLDLGTSIEDKNKSDNLTIYKEYFKSAILFYLGFKKDTNKKINKVITHHGIYIPHGIIQ